MQIQLLGETINYSATGQTGSVVILLHGWGQNLSMMAPIETALAPNFQVYNIDLPGFGASSTPTTPWGVFEYMLLLREFITTLKLDPPILIAHSFGARIALLYSAKYPVNKMVITGGAGLLPRRSLALKLKMQTYKIIKRVLLGLRLEALVQRLSGYFGSEDYKKLSPLMQTSFKYIVNFDLRPYLALIQAEVLLVWGDQDQATPLWMGLVMEQEIPQAGLAIFQGDDHFAYWHQMDRFLKVLAVFLLGDK